MTGPVRIQLSRRKGFRMPDNTVAVTRPGPLGNPFVIQGALTRETAVAAFRDTVRGCWNPSVLKCLPDAELDLAYNAHHAWIMRMGGDPLAVVRDRLRGRNIGCWCGLDMACHGDVYLDVANT